MDSKQEVIKLDQLVAAGVKLTPMFVQYHEVKKSYPDMLLLFRMGDFYELFFEDAVIAANTLGITLTYRGKLGDHKIPMAGIPHHAANNYVDRLTGCGMKLAICEQVEDPKEAKGIVKRAVTQVVTPGMPYDLEKSEQSIRHYMCAAFQQDDHFYLTALDYTTGEFSGHSLNSEQELIQKLEILDPKEFITYLGQWDNLINLSATLTQLNLLKTHLSQEYFLPKYSANYIEKLIPGFNQDQIIQLNQGIIPAIGALSYYIDSAQGVGLPVHIHPFKMVNSQGEMRISMPTLKGLEIIPNHRDNYKDSLLGFFDRTKSAIGSRRLKQLFTTPLTDLELISQRAGTIEKLVATPSLLVVVRQQLALTRDLERILAKLSSGKITACDLLALATTVMVFKELIPKLQALTSSPPWSLLANREYTQLTSFATKIESALNPEPGASLEKGNLIMPSFSAARDRLSTLCSGRTMELMELEERYRQETGIKKLKIKSNNVHGHFIEVSNSQQHLVPTYFERRQTLVNCERYTTKELNKFEQEVVYAQERLEQLERKLFKELTGELSTLAPLIMQLAELIGQVDSFASIAQISLEEEFVRPTFSNKKRVLEVKGGHHPLIKAAIRERFVPHDLYLDQEHFFGLITGPNMAGKTTIMREIAIIQFLAQLGSFVPAQKANLSICDYLFSRLGARDNILKGQSTFMVEMAESSEILRHATQRSLIILDEVGRGTSTYDGMSIAWSLVEHFLEHVKAFTLFATHYHELIELVDIYPCAKNLTMETVVDGDDVHFLYRLLEGGATQSYGIHVAKLAGLPPHVLNRAKEILHSLESSGQKLTVKQMELPLEQTMPSEQKEDQISARLAIQIKELKLNHITPMEAMNKLADLQSELQ